MDYLIVIDDISLSNLDHVKAAFGGGRVGGKYRYQDST
jgi:hypothetical protein